MCPGFESRRAHELFLKMLLKIYRDLLKKHGKQNWWPKTGLFKPEKLEICIGAILTQNTSWKNVERAIKNLIKEDLTSAEKIVRTKLEKLERIIKPSGFYRQKAKRIKELCNLILKRKDFFKSVSREELLSIKGIGKETADSILLYACNKLTFVIDSYTRRFLLRLGLIKGNETYDYLQEFFEKKIPKDLEMYKEFHALIVADEKLRKLEKNN